MNNWKLEYYITPDEYVCFDKRQKLIRDIDLTRWKMIHIGPADKNTYNWKIGFFVEDAEFMSKFLYRLKADDEQLTVRICESWKKSIFRERLLIGEADIGEEISECLGGKGVFIYETENEINKYVHINPGETLDCFFKEEHLEDIVGVISNIATVTDYYKYELGD